MECIDEGVDRVGADCLFVRIVDSDEMERFAYFG